MRWNKVFPAFLLVLVAIVGATASDVPIVHKKKYAMGTLFEIVVYDSFPEHASAAIDEAFDEIVRLDELLSNYKPESELSRLNRSAHFHAESVSPDTYRVIAEAVRYSRISAAKFDITVGPLVDLWKTAMKSGIAPSAEQESEARTCVGYDKIALLPANHIEFRSTCLRIDVGGIGKGYALDRAADVLRAEGITRALLDAGGSTLYAIGSPPGQAGWLVQMRDSSGRLNPQVVLSDNSLSTSEQTPPSLLQYQSAGHIIDPETGLPLRSSCAVSVLATTATASDALSTTLLLVGPVTGKRIIEQTAASAAIWIAPDGHSEIASSGPAITLHHDVQSGRRQTKGEAARNSCQ